MKRPFIRVHFLSPPRQRQSSLADDRGVTIILVAFAMIGILGMAALSIDVITLYLARLEAQRSADAAALTAARIISISGITGTADPGTDPGDWTQICGGPGSVASQAAQAVAYQNTVAGIAVTSITVKYSGGGSGPSTSCSGFPTAFAVNPMVTVQVKRTGLPSFFARIWGGPSDTVTASATAEAFNPSASDLNGNGGPTGTVTPVQPRCVKPWVVPNRDPGNPPSPTCSGGGCTAFVTIADGSINHPGISLSGPPTGGVIGETFTLFADCGGGAGATPCSKPDNPPIANVTGGTGTYNGVAAPFGLNLEYLPGLAPASSVAVPACANPGYQGAVAGCDQSTVYQCGIQSASATPPNTLDLTENPGGASGDSAVGMACSLTGQLGGPLLGQDTLDTTAYPFTIKAGSSNPSGIASNSVITSSNSIVSLPIYDDIAALGAGTTPPVTIVGFLQVFVNQIKADGSLNVTVLNVAGCGNGATAPGPAVKGSSPVPVRLVQ